MEENTRNTNRSDSPLDDNTKESRKETVGGNVGHQKDSAYISGTSSMDEKSSALGRRDKGTGLASKDGLTGSDYDGQVTE